MFRFLRNSLLLALACVAVVLLMPGGSAASVTDPTGDAAQPETDFVNLDASHDATNVYVDMTLVDTLLLGNFEDTIEFRVDVNGQDFGMCWSLGAVLVYDYTNGATATAASANYDWATDTIEFQVAISSLNTATIPADVFARSGYGECSTFGNVVADDRVPDAGTITTASGGGGGGGGGSCALPSGPGSEEYFFHGDSEFDDNRAGVSTRWMDVSGPSGGPRVIAAHDDGLGVSPNPVVFATDPAVSCTYYLGDGNPSTSGAPTDVVDVHVCMSEPHQSAFVPRVVASVIVDGDVLGSRLSNDLLIPTQLPQCYTIQVPINQHKDDQTPANDVPDLGNPLNANGDFVLNPGSIVEAHVEVVTPFGGATWYLLYDSTSYPSSLTLIYSDVGGSGGGGGGGTTLYVEANGPYEAFIDEEISLYGYISNGTAPFGCLWQTTNPNVLIDDDEDCVTTAEFAAAGTYAITLRGNDTSVPQLVNTDVAIIDVRYRTAEENETKAAEKAKAKNPPAPGASEPDHPDEDQDGIDDRFDNCAGALAGAPDMDRDGRGDTCDADMDGDGIPNGRDNCFMVVKGKRGNPATALWVDTANPDQRDSDGNGIGDACEKDTDLDGISDALDNCPLIYNPFQSDLDLDGVGNVCDDDMDGDGVANDKDAFPFDPREWSDMDGDGIGDNSDPDMDGDGFLNAFEVSVGTKPDDPLDFPKRASGEGTQSVDPAASVAALGTTGFILLVLIVGLLVAVAIVLTRRF